MKSEENYTNKIINNLKDYFKQNQIENYTNPSFENKMRLVWINSPKKIIKNSWLNNFGDVNKRMSKKLDSLLFGISNKLFFFESFILIKNKGIKYSNKKYYVENNLNKYSYIENGTKRELDYYGKTFFYEIIDYNEFLNYELGYKVISDGVRRFYLFSLGKKSYYFEESKTYIPRFNIIFNELISILNSQYSIKKNEDYQKRQEFQQKLKREKRERLERLEEEKKLRDLQNLLKNLERKKILQEGITKFIKEFDSDKDGIIDFNQGGDDFMNLLKKHQKTIIQVDQNHITKLIQISNYLKTKRGNIQTQFEKIKKSRNSKQLNEFTGILKNQIDTFNLLNYNSLIMIISLVEGDLITFNEIYLTFDKLNIFNSNWENQVSDKLNNIDSKLDEVIYSINKMELSIVNEILGMSI
jgi:hypothetical protein